MPSTQMSSEQSASLKARLQEARICSVRARGNGFDRPQLRPLIDVLGSATRYGATLEQDTVYAILGMTGISTVTGISGWQPSGKDMLIDYSRPPAMVYRDITFWLLSRDCNLSLICGLWNDMQKKRISTDDLPSWVIDWRSSRCDERCSRLISGGSAKIGSSSRMFGRRLMLSSAAPDLITSEQLGYCHIFQERPDVMLLKGIALSYVALMTELTCDLHYWLSPRTDKPDTAPYLNRYDLGSAGRGIHVTGRPAPFSILLHIQETSDVRKFVEGEDAWRLAILGCDRTWQVALVPANTQKGDIIVATQPEVMPLVLSPRDPNMYSKSLYHTPDLFERCPNTDGPVGNTYRLCMEALAWLTETYYMGLLGLFLTLGTVIIVATPWIIAWISPALLAPRSRFLRAMLQVKFRLEIAVELSRALWEPRECKELRTRRVLDRITLDYNQDHYIIGTAHMEWAWLMEPSPSLTPKLSIPTMVWSFAGCVNDRCRTSTSIKAYPQYFNPQLPRQLWQQSMLSTAKVTQRPRLPRSCYDNRRWGYC